MKGGMEVEGRRRAQVRPSSNNVSQSRDGYQHQMDPHTHLSQPTPFIRFMVFLFSLRLFDEFIYNKKISKYKLGNFSPNQETLGRFFRGCSKPSLVQT